MCHYHAGLANRVVPDGQSLHEAISLAEQLSRFPQACLRADRESALAQAMAGSRSETARDPLRQEYQRGKQVIPEAIKGAREFTKGKKDTIALETELNFFPFQR